MRCKKEMLLLYAVTDRTWTQSQTLIEQVESAIQGGVTCVQLREKELDDQAFLKEAIAMKNLCHQYNIPLIINDNVEVAIKSGADGIHVGQSDMQVKNVRALVGNQMMIGVSVRTLTEALDAQKSGADYLGVGAVFSTTTKLDAQAVSYDVLKEICDSVSIPVVAIGGINKNNILQLSGSGVDGIALISAIFSSKDIKTECRLLRNLSYEMISH